MDDRVDLFNRLPRPKATPTGLPNHWIFGVCHVDMHPAGDLLLAVHPQSQFLRQGGPAQILALATEREKAEAIIPCLLDAFTKWDEHDPRDSAPFAPTTWSTLNPQIAGALEAGLTNHGVKPELCQVGVCSEEERGILETARASLFEQLTRMVAFQPAPVQPGDSERCHGCGMSRQCFFQPLKTCSGCKSAFYHSKDCQKKHWKRHKPTCVSRTNAATLDSYAYYNTIAPTDEAALALMKELKLDSHPSRGGLGLPVRRLVFTGQDVPTNMRLLFGPQWEVHMKKTHEDARIECLLDPPPGSPSHVMNAYMDDSSLVRSPRPATEAEQHIIRGVRDMQERIQQKVGAGRSPSPGDMQSILRDAGGAWTAQIGTYQLALNTTNQGVPPGGNRF